MLSILQPLVLSYKRPLSVLFMFFFTVATFAQIKEGDVMFDYKSQFADKELTLNGTGTRELLFIDLYAGGLYLKEKSNDAMRIASATDHMAIKLKIVSGLVTQTRMIDAIYDGFEDATYDNTDPLKARIEIFISFFSEPIVKGDEFDIVYVKEKGTVLYKNGKQLGAIKGQDFKFALFKIWLGEKPVSKSLKEGMLGI